MDIVVRGRNVQLQPRLKQTAREKLARLARFTHDDGRVEVEFSEVRNPRVADNQICEVTVHLKGHFVKAHAASIEPEAALDLVLDKVEHQVARIKEKRVSRSHPRRRRILAGSAPALDDDFEEDDDSEARIVRTKEFAIKPMDPEEAALQMDLLGHDFFLFNNAQNGRCAVIYRRRDGHLGLIETAG